MINLIWFLIVFIVAYLIGRYLHIQRDNPDIYDAISSLTYFEDNGKRDCFGLFDRCHQLAIRDKASWVVNGKCCKCQKEPEPDSVFCRHCGQRLKWDKR